MAHASFFARDDDLPHRVKLNEWQDFIRVIVDSLGERPRANFEAWHRQGSSRGS